MNIVATLKNKEEMEHLSKLGVDVFLLHTKQFTRNTISSFTVQEIKEMTDIAHQMEKQVYILINVMIHEEMLDPLNAYIQEIKSCKLDGIVGFDFSIYPILQSQQMESLLIFQPGTLNTNFYDAWFCQKHGIKGMTISREVTLQELLEISDSVQNIEYSIVGHGYIDMFYSRRPLITNYSLFKELKLPDIKNNHSFHLQEELRNDDFYPIIEDPFGTTIFRSKKLQSFQELGVITPYLQDFFVERLFLSDQEYDESILAYKNELNQANFLSKYAKEYDSGFYYRKIARSKEQSL